MQERGSGDLVSSACIDWATTEGRFTVDADRWTRRAAQLAQPLTRRFKRHGYKITPERAWMRRDSTWSRLLATMKLIIVLWDRARCC